MNPNEAKPDRLRLIVALRLLWVPIAHWAAVLLAYFGQCYLFGDYWGSPDPWRRMCWPASLHMAGLVALQVIALVSDVRPARLALAVCLPSLAVAVCGILASLAGIVDSSFYHRVAGLAVGSVPFAIIGALFWGQRLIAASKLDRETRIEWQLSLGFVGLAILAYSSMLGFALIGLLFSD